MAVGDIVLAFHVTTGTAALLLGPVAFFIGRDPHHPLSLVYQAAVAAVALSAVVLAGFDLAGLWWLNMLALGTEALALGGLYVAPAVPAANGSSGHTCSAAPTLL